METIYSLKGWVKEVIDNKNANVLCQFEDNGVGNSAKQLLVEIAKAQIKYWKEFCENLDTTNETEVYVNVYANDILPNGLLCRKEQECVYWNFISIDPKKKNTNI